MGWEGLPIAGTSLVTTLPSAEDLLAALYNTSPAVQAPVIPTGEPIVAEDTTNQETYEFGSADSGSDTGGAL